MHTDTTAWYLALSLMPGIGPMACAALKERFGSIREAYAAPLPDLSSILGPALATRFVAARSSIDPRRVLQTYVRKGIHVAGMEDGIYPPDLVSISDPPLCVYIKGNVSCLTDTHKLRFAIVGTRNPTEYGKQIARTISAGLVSAGWCIVSGLALGIDAAAHQAAIEAGGTTIAVLGCGVDLRYPPSNANLYDLILERGGAVVSEFPPGMTVQKGMFVTRNRIISALSRGVMVVEGRSTSGALITARYAGEQGKEVFAIPAPITSPQSEAPNMLLKQGAVLVRDVNDILDEFHLHRSSHVTRVPAPELQGEEGMVYALLTNEPLTADNIAFRRGIPVILALTYISSLEIRKLIYKREDGAYSLV